MTIIALVGNPNAGKSTLFNALVGARQKVGNWPGVTVERKQGNLHLDKETVQIEDLPGLYSLQSAEKTSPDQEIVRAFLQNDKPDLIINVVDGTNLERHLGLTAQLIDFGCSMIVAVTMTDELKKKGLSLDIKALSQQLQCPVIAIVVPKHQGLDDLKTSIKQHIKNEFKSKKSDLYPDPIEKMIKDLNKNRWQAVSDLYNCTDDRLDPLRQALQLDPFWDGEMILTEARYRWASQIANESLIQDASKPIHRISPWQNWLDRWVMNRWLGPVFFLFMMYVLFTVSINISGLFIDFFDITTGAFFVEGVGWVMDQFSSPTWLKVIIADGIGGGIQLVASFIPVVGFLFLFLSIFEDSGYLARAAVVTDRVMRAIGLPGKAFVPLLVGLGCNVPSIMATRTLDKQSDRVVTAMMAPFMSCGARLAVYALFTTAFFGTQGGFIVFSLYLIGIAMAVLTGLLLRKTLMRGGAQPFVYELPPYRAPRFKDVMIKTWFRLKGFVIEAGQAIIIVAACLNICNSLGTDGTWGNQDSQNSVLSQIGQAIVPAFEPMGLHEDNWPAAVGIFTGIFAKEAVVGTLDAIYGQIDQEEAGEKPTDEGFNLIGRLKEAAATIPDHAKGLSALLTDPLGISSATQIAENTTEAAEAQGVQVSTLTAMQKRFDGGWGAFAYLVFILLYTPCVAVLGAIKKEFGWRWVGFSATWTFFTAYAAGVVVYQLSHFALQPLLSTAWIGGTLGATMIIFYTMRWMGKEGPKPT